MFDFNLVTPIGFLFDKNKLVWVSLGPYGFLAIKEIELGLMNVGRAILSFNTF